MASGIVIPDTAKEKPQRAEAMAVGDSDEVKVSIGDTVILRKFGGTEVKIDGDERVLVGAEDILGVVEG